MSCDMYWGENQENIFKQLKDRPIWRKSKNWDWLLWTKLCLTLFGFTQVGLNSTKLSTCTEDY
jgi:hypothetical protein